MEGRTRWIVSGRARVKVAGQEPREVKTSDALTLPANVDVVWEIKPPNVCDLCLFP